MAPFRGKGRQATGGEGDRRTRVRAPPAPPLLLWDTPDAPPVGPPTGNPGKGTQTGAQHARGHPVPGTTVVDR